MRRHLSILMLAARSNIYYVLAIFFVMAAGEGAVFYLLVKAKGTDLPLEEILSQSQIPLIFGIAFLLLCACLSLTGAEFLGSKVRYTLQRLTVGEKEILCWWAVYNSICFFAFWAFQLLLMLLFCRTYLETMDPSCISDQTLFVACYRNNFLHNLLPLEETSRYLRNIWMVLCLGFTASCFSYHRRHDKMSITVALMAALAVVFFQHPMGDMGSDLMVGGGAFLIAFTAGFGVWKEMDHEN